MPIAKECSFESTLTSRNYSLRSNEEVFFARVYQKRERQKCTVKQIISVETRRKDPGGEGGKRERERQRESPAY